MELDESSNSRGVSEVDGFLDISGVAAAQIAQGPQIHPEADAAVLQLQVKSQTASLGNTLN
jgi:hypothetical protein